MTVKKVIGWAVVIFALWFVVTNTQGAIALANQLKDAASAVGNAFATFLTSL
jgi:hypothetical protein